MPGRYIAAGLYLEVVAEVPLCITNFVFSSCVYFLHVHNVVMLDSEFTRSTAVGIITACPHEDLAPLMDMIDHCTVVMYLKLHVYTHTNATPEERER